jgi:hypothetical protein
MSLARSRWLRPVRDRLGRALHQVIDRRVADRLGRELPALEARIAAGKAGHVIGPEERLLVDATADVAPALLDTRSGCIFVGANAIVSHGAAILTGTMDVDARGVARAASLPPASRDVVIEAGAWIAARAVVLGPCRIGADAVVAAGAVVTGDVPPSTVVAGVPARVLRELSPTKGLPPAVEVATDVGPLYVPANEPDPGAGSLDPEIVRPLLRSGMTVLDAAAGVGHTTLACAASVAAGGRVVALERRPDRAWLLRANAARYERTHGVAVSVAPHDSATVDVLVEPDATVDVLCIAEDPELEGLADLIARCRPIIVSRPASASDGSAIAFERYEALGYVIDDSAGTSATVVLRPG